jgi:hypothetical protein
MAPGKNINYEFAVSYNVVAGSGTEFSISYTSLMSSASRSSLKKEKKSEPTFSMIKKAFQHINFKKNLTLVTVPHYLDTS